MSHKTWCTTVYQLLSKSLSPIVHNAVPVVTSLCRVWSICQIRWKVTWKPSQNSRKVLDIIRLLQSYANHSSSSWLATTMSGSTSRTQPYKRSTRLSNLFPCSSPNSQEISRYKLMEVFVKVLTDSTGSHLRPYIPSFERAVSSLLVTTSCSIHVVVTHMFVSLFLALDPKSM